MTCETMKQLELKESDALDHIRLTCDRVRRARWIEQMRLVQREQIAHCDECDVCGEMRKAA